MHHKKRALWPQFLKLAASGISAKAIARALGVAPSTVSRWAEEVRVPLFSIRDHRRQALEQEILELAQRGLGVTEIALALGEPLGTVVSAKRRLGLETEDRRCHARELREKAAELCLKGMSYKDIAPGLGIAPSTVQRWLNERGMARKRGWRAGRRRLQPVPHDGFQLRG